MSEFEVSLIMDVADELKRYARGVGGFHCAYATEQNLKIMEAILNAFDASYKQADVVKKIDDERRRIQDAAHAIKNSDDRKAYLEINTISPELVREERLLREQMGRNLIEVELYRYLGSKIKLTGATTEARAALCQCWTRLGCLSDADGITEV
jgi:hypothetical protein